MKQTNKYYILLILAMMFAAPGIAAYIFYNHPLWLGTTQNNKGVLLNPPMTLHSLDKQQKWRIVLWSDTPCEEACLAQLDILARVRLALGRKLYQVDQWLLVNDQESTLSAKTQAFLKDHDFRTTLLSTEDKEQFANFSPKTRIFIVNPDNFLVLTYQARVNPNDVYKDLKQLLNTTEKSG